MASLSELFQAREYSTWWRFFSWKARNYLQRKTVHYSERLKITSYQSWLKKHPFVIQASLGNPSRVKFGFVITPGADGEKTLAALQGLAYPAWYAWDTTGSLKTDDERIRTDWADAHSLGGFSQALKRFITQADLDMLSFITAGDYFGSNYLDVLNSHMGDEMPVAIYSDEDLYRPLPGRLHGPWLKPDPSPMLFYSTNYLQHAFFHRSLVQQLSLEVDTPASIVEQLSWDALNGDFKAHHVPGILYHCVVQPHNQETEQEVAHLACLEHNLQKQGLSQVSVKSVAGQQVHVSWAVKDQLVSIIIPTHNQSSRLLHLLDSLRENTTYTYYEIILVDNQSDEEGMDALYANLSTDPRIRILRREELFNYSLYNNIGANAAVGDLLVFLNNDMKIIHPAWLSELVMWVQRPGVGVVGARLMYPNGRIQHAGVVIGLVGSAGHVLIGEYPEISTPHGSPLWYRNMLAITGACMAIRREVFEILGGFDEGYRLTFSDIALCLKAIQHGYQVVYNPFACLEHEEGGTRGDTIPDEDIRRMVKEFTPWVEQGDPFFNPLLSRLIATPALRRLHEDTPQQTMRMIKALAEYPLGMDKEQA